LFLLATFVIELPETEREEVEKIPPRVARMILQQKSLSPKPQKKEVAPKTAAKPDQQQSAPPKPVVQKSKPVTKLKPTPAKPINKPKKSQPTAAQVAEARQVAAKSGVLALQDKLAAMRKMTDIDQLRSRKLHTAASGSERRTQRDLVQSRAESGSDGIVVTQVTKPSRQPLAERSVTQVTTPAELAELEALASTNLKQRTSEEIQLAFDQHKASFYALYRRALRSILGLEGRVVFDLTVLPSGQVEKCRVVSSELNNKELERKLRARIMLMTFAPREVETWTGNYHVDFSPAG
jgi:TonB family protein